MPRTSQTESQLLETHTGCRLGPYLSHNPVSATQIWQWCSAMGDNNPAYRPGENQVAPPAMMQMWTMRDVNDRYAPGSTDAQPYRVFDEMTAMGYPANVAVSYDISIYRYLRIGDSVKHYTTVVNISDKKTTRLGTGFFVTEQVEYLTRDDIPFAEALITYFQYTSALVTWGGGFEDPATAKSEASTQYVAGAASGNWRPHSHELPASRFGIGDTLPGLAVPITHKLIIAGAIATQDFTPVHHNLPAAQAAGMPDIFMNILTTCGLSVRYLTDWAGSGSRLTSIKFRLMAPNMPGDVMRMGGEVVAVHPETSGAQVEVAFTGKNRRGIHIFGTATLALPSTNTVGY